MQYVWKNSLKNITNVKLSLTCSNNPKLKINKFLLLIILFLLLTTHIKGRRKWVAEVEELQGWRRRRVRTLEKIAGLIGSRKQSIRAISAQFCYDAGRHLLLQTPNFPTVQCISAEFSN